MESIGLKKKFQRWTAKTSKPSSENEPPPPLEILSQITLPMILILAFIVLTKLSLIIKEYEEKKRDLEYLYEQISDSEKEYIDKTFKSIIDLQKQRLIKALGELRFKEKIGIGLYHPSVNIGNPVSVPEKDWRLETYLELESAEKINMGSGRLADESWKNRFNNIYQMIQDKESRDYQVFKYYHQLLDLTGIEDPYSQDIVNLMEKLHQPIDPIHEKISTIDNQYLITSDNRRFVWDELHNFLRNIENDTVMLQQKILIRIIDHFIYNPEDLDKIKEEDSMLKELQGYIQKFNFVYEIEQKEYRDKICTMIEKIVRNDLEDHRYWFLPGTWQFTKK